MDAIAVVIIIVGLAIALALIALRFRRVGPVVTFTIRGGPDVSNVPRPRSEHPATASATPTYSCFAASVTDGAS
jgi:hypothetical protein